jgi:hypothetical protein
VPVSEVNPGLDLDLPLAQTLRFSAYGEATEEIALLFSAGWEDWSTADNVSLGFGAVHKLSESLEASKTRRTDARRAMLLDSLASGTADEAKRRAGFFFDSHAGPDVSTFIHSVP